MSTITAIGLDLAKNVFQVHGEDDDGRVVLRRTLRRAQVAQFFAQLHLCLVGMRSCATSQYCARKLASFGYQTQLIPPQYVEPYVGTNKNDANDEAAICEDVKRPGPDMRFASLKTADQQSIPAVHLIGKGWVKGRTACAKRIRALMGEFGVGLPQGIEGLQPAPEPPPRPILRGEDFRVGDTVGFEGRDLVQHVGKIVRLNQTSATVACDKGERTSPTRSCIASSKSDRARYHPAAYFKTGIGGRLSPIRPDRLAY